MTSPNSPPNTCEQLSLEATDDSLGMPIPFNAFMIATFFLVALDMTFKLTDWLHEQKVDWKKLMVMICGKVGRPTAGVTYSTNSISQMIHGASGFKLPLERMYIAPQAPSFSIADMKDLEAVREYEQPLRGLWCKTRAIAELAPTMFQDYPKYAPESYASPVVTEKTAEVSEMPRIHGPDDMLAMNTRLRVVIEDPRQLLSGCVADYAVEQLQKTGNDPTKVVVPGLDGFKYPIEV